MIPQRALIDIAAVAACGFIALGYALARSTTMWRIDIEAAALRGRLTRLALLFTLSGRAIPIVLLAMAGIVATAVTHAPVRVAIAIFVSQVVSQGAVEQFKRIVHRTRPDAWLVREEAGFSYPSGHAATAIVFYGSWLAFALLLPMTESIKIALVALLAFWIAGIGWSRLALGAHYPTDVIGGTLFGVAWACATWAMLPTQWFLERSIR